MHAKRCQQVDQLLQAGRYAESLQECTTVLGGKTSVKQGVTSYVAFTATRISLTPPAAASMQTWSQQVHGKSRLRPKTLLQQRPGPSQARSHCQKDSPPGAAWAALQPHPQREPSNKFADPNQVPTLVVSAPPVLT